MAPRLPLVLVGATRPGPPHRPPPPSQAQDDCASLATASQAWPGPSQAPCPYPPPSQLPFPPPPSQSNLYPGVLSQVPAYPTPSQAGGSAASGGDGLLAHALPPLGSAPHPRQPHTGALRLFSSLTLGGGGGGSASGAPPPRPGASPPRPRPSATAVRLLEDISRQYATDAAADRVLRRLDGLDAAIARLAAMVEGLATGRAVAPPPEGVGARLDALQASLDGVLGHMATAWGTVAASEETRPAVEAVGGQVRKGGRARLPRAAAPNPPPARRTGTKRAHQPPTRLVDELQETAGGRALRARGARGPRLPLPPLTARSRAMRAASTAAPSMALAPAPLPRHPSPSPPTPSPVAADGLDELLGLGCAAGGPAGPPPPADARILAAVRARLARYAARVCPAEE